MPQRQCEPWSWRANRVRSLGERSHLFRTRRSRLSLIGTFGILRGLATDTVEASAPGLLLGQKRALERLEDSAPVSGDASLSVSPKHLVRQWGDEEDKDVGGFLDAEIRVESSMDLERLSDQGHIPGESSFPLHHSLA